MTDCLLVGLYEPDFPAHVELLKSMGADSGAYRDLDLAFIWYEGAPSRASDILTRLGLPDPLGSSKPFHNADFLWPVIQYLGTQLARAGHSFDYVNTPHTEWDSFTAKLSAKPKVVAITTTLYVWAQPILELIKTVRDISPGSIIVVGGPFIANQQQLLGEADLERLLMYMGADAYIFSREGEQTLGALVEAVKTGQRLAQVPNLAFRDGPGLRFTDPQDEVNDLADGVDYALFPKSDLGDLVSLRTARSCPYACAFCGFPQRSGAYTYLKPDDVERKLDRLAERGVTTLSFLDDTFNVPKGRFKEILRRMIRKNYGFRWNSFYRPDQGDPETIELMAESGCEGVFVGVESGSDRMLAAMKKTARRNSYLEAIPRLRAAGIIVHTNLIVGFPGETPDTIRETEDLLAQAQPDYFRPQLWYADPATPVWNDREALGIKGSGFAWQHNTMTSEEALGWIDRMMVSVENSVWLPQQGFELWSLFYLQRRGFSRAQTRHFVRCFNAAVAEKLLATDTQPVSEGLKSALMSAAAPTEERPMPKAVGQALESVSSARYLAAERRWFRGLGRASPGEAGGHLGPEPHACPDPWHNAQIDIGPINDLVAHDAKADPSEVALGVFAQALNEYLAIDRVFVIAGCDRDEGSALGPICFDAMRTLDEMIAQSARHFETAAPHWRFARRLLNGWQTRSKGRFGAAGCSAWFLAHDGRSAARDLAQTLQHAISSDKGFGLEVFCGDRPELYLWWTGAPAQGLSDRIASALKGRDAPQAPRTKGASLEV